MTIEGALPPIDLLNVRSGTYTAILDPAQGLVANLRINTDHNVRIVNVEYLNPDGVWVPAGSQLPGGRYEGQFRWGLRRVLENPDECRVAWQQRFGTCWCCGHHLSEHVVGHQNLKPSAKPRGQARILSDGGDARIVQGNP